MDLLYGFEVRRHYNTICLPSLRFNTAAKKRQGAAAVEKRETSKLDYVQPESRQSQKSPKPHEFSPSHEFCLQSKRSNELLQEAPLGERSKMANVQTYP